MEYSESVFVEQPAGPLLQIHALKEEENETARFSLFKSYPWFQIDESTGMLSLNRSLDRKDFALLSEYIVRDRPRKLCFWCWQKLITWSKTFF